MKQAKPTTEQQDAVFRFLQSLEQTMSSSPDDEQIAECIDEHWHKVANCWQRVVEAGRVCIENACDPDLNCLDFKPEIREQQEEIQRLKDDLDNLKEIVQMFGER